jgi:hypothetical protein
MRYLMPPEALPSALFNVTATTLPARGPHIVKPGL